jgi:hypothetical protein
MKISQSIQLLSYAVAAGLLLVSMKISATSCDEGCSAEAPTCECVCVCYGKGMAVTASAVVPAVNVVQYVVPFDSTQSPLFLVTDIFRPPIA